MRPPMRMFSLLAFALYAAACGSGSDTPTGPTPPSGTETVYAPASIDAGTCTTLDSLTALVNDVFGAGSPDANSALGKLNNLQHQLDIENLSAAQDQAFNLVEFILKKYKQGGFQDKTAELIELVNSIFCYAGLNIVIGDPWNTWLIYPTDAAQTLIAGNGLAGTALPGHVVSEPTLVTITQLTDPGFPGPGGSAGAGPLNTKLDQYPYFFEFSKSSATNAPLTAPVVVGVCPIPGIDPDVLARLRLGHDANAGFEVTPPADASFLTCPTTTASSKLPAWMRTLASLVMPKPLFAKMRASGGVGGTAGEFSPFAPVDAELSFSGGVGGTAGEFLRGLFLMDLESTCDADPLEAPIGTPLDPSCRPGVKLVTHLGTALTGAKVQFDMTAGGGTIAPETSGSCGIFASTFETTTNADGKAGACWTMGMTAGTNTVVATPGTGGDVPEGVTFTPKPGPDGVVPEGVTYTPTTIIFTAIANPPSGLVFAQQPDSGNNVVAGANIPVTVNIVDKNGTTVQGWNGSVSLELNQNSFSAGLNTTSASATEDASQGVATFPGLEINEAATGYQMTASATLLGTPESVDGNFFNVVAYLAYGLDIVQGNGQTAAAGSTLPIAPTVLVTDIFGNPVNAASIAWLAGGSSAGSVSPAQTTTGTDGKTATSWTLGDGDNELTATLARGILGDSSVLFHATGTSTLSVISSCAPGGSGDPINASGKTYAFWLPNPGRNKSIKQIQLFFSSAGKANAPTPYQLRLTTQSGSFDPAVPAIATDAFVFLRGNNSENKPVTFVLSTPILGESGNNAPKVMVQLQLVGANPDGATINFNSGQCSPGSKCKVRCDATEVNSLTPYPDGTTYRQSVGIVVKGN